MAPETSPGYPLRMNGFVVAEALPPETLVSAPLREIAESLAGSSPNGQASVDDILPLLRLVVPFGDPTGLALPAPVPVVCEIGQSFALRFSPAPDMSLTLLQGVGTNLQSAALTARFPQIAQAPRPNANILWTTHNKLRQWPAYADLAVDIQIGLIRLLERANWQQHRAASKTIDATLTALYRILPQIDASELEKALAANDRVAAGEVVQRAARKLTYLRQPDTPLPPETCRGYVRDFCQTINHPEWSATQQWDTPIGSNGVTSRGPNSSASTQTDHPPASSPSAQTSPAVWFDESQFEQAARRTAEEIPAGNLDEEGADELPARRERMLTGEDLAVMREFRHLLAWNAAHPNDMAALMKIIYSGCVRNGVLDLNPVEEGRLTIRSLLLALCCLGQTVEWLRQVVVVDTMPDPEALVVPHYVVDLDALVYVSPIASVLPQRPQHAPDLYEPVSAYWFIPLCEPLIPWWRELARRQPQGTVLFPIEIDRVNKALRDTTTKLRQTSPNLPSLTEGRLRAASIMLLEAPGQLDPLLAAFVSGQWRTALRVPLHYTTVPVRLLANRYREAVKRVWPMLRASAPQIPDVPPIQPAELPAVNMGSPYLPKPGVIRTVFQAAQAAAEKAAALEEKHNALTLRLLLGLDVFCGLRSGETDEFPIVQIDLSATWQGQPWPHFFLPEAKGNWWTTAARGLPLPRPLLQLAREVLASSQGQTSLHFFIGGERVPITPAAVVTQLDQLGVPRPRWHDGRHLLRCYLLERGMPGEAINFVLGHQAQGHEGLNPYRPFDLWQAWNIYQSLVADLATLLEWKETP